MGKEIEHKFLVDAPQWKTFKKAAKETAPLSSVLISQGYLSKAVTHKVRVRLVETTDKYILGNQKGFLTVKGKTVGHTRDEFEYPIPIEDASAMLKLTDGILTKKRFFVPFHGHVWSVDQILGINKGLVIAEIELKAEGEMFVKPDWVLGDITHDRRYSSTYLATHKIV